MSTPNEQPPPCPNFSNSVQSFYPDRFHFNVPRNIAFPQYIAFPQTREKSKKMCHNLFEVYCSFVNDIKLPPEGINCPEFGLIVPIQPTRNRRDHEGKSWENLVCTYVTIKLITGKISSSNPITISTRLCGRSSDIANIPTN